MNGSTLLSASAGPIDRWMRVIEQVDPMLLNVDSPQYAPYYEELTALAAEHHTEGLHGLVRARPDERRSLISYIQMGLQSPTPMAIDRAENGLQHLRLQGHVLTLEQRLGTEASLKMLLLGDHSNSMTILDRCFPIGWGLALSLRQAPPSLDTGMHQQISPVAHVTQTQWRSPRRTNGSVTALRPALKFQIVPENLSRFSEYRLPGILYTATARDLEIGLLAPRILRIGALTIASIHNDDLSHDIGDLVPRFESPVDVLMIGGELQASKRRNLDAIVSMLQPRLLLSHSRSIEYEAGSVGTASWLKLGPSSDVYGSLRYAPQDGSLSVEVGSPKTLRQLFANAIPADKRDKIQRRLTILERKVYTQLNGEAGEMTQQVIDRVKKLVASYIYALEMNPYADADTRVDLLEEQQVVLDTYAPHHEQELYFKAFEYFLIAWGMKEIT